MKKQKKKSRTANRLSKRFVENFFCRELYISQILLRDAWEGIRYRSNSSKLPAIVYLCLPQARVNQFNLNGVERNMGLGFIFRAARKVQVCKNWNFEEN